MRFFCIIIHLKGNTVQPLFTDLKIFLGKFKWSVCIILWGIPVLETKKIIMENYMDIGGISRSPMSQQQVLYIV